MNSFFTTSAATIAPRNLFVTFALCLFTALLPTNASPIFDGISGAPCTSAEQCKGSRTCYYIPLDSLASFGPCNGRDECFCAPIDISDLICSSDDDCSVPGEVCAGFDQLKVSGCLSLETVEKYPQLFRTDNDADLKVSDEAVAQSPDDSHTPLGNSEGIQGVALVEELEPSSSPKSENACIALKHLEHLSSDQLLFPTHVPASVLCDSHGNCATPGHVISFEGRFMMMKSYCASVGCQTTIELVNSPKYVPKLRIPSQSNTLLFTPFAARYASRIEEKILRVALRIGL
ncbi:unnamed protein product [Agarophyton chilense]